MSSETSLVVASVITPAHKSLGQKFADRVVDLLQNNPVTIKKYAVESEYFETETAELMIDEKTTLIMVLRTKT